MTIALIGTFGFLVIISSATSLSKKKYNADIPDNNPEIYPEGNKPAHRIFCAGML